ncbi:MAG: hypothetical protein JWQ09_4219 [Segetibacter sp.]|nr:hypothetical protein [Segetibacter sp.]
MIRRYWVIIFFVGLVSGLSSQNKRGPIAKFSFNDGKNHEELSGRKAKLVGANFSEDRFGNANSAVYFAGNPDSYMNLGEYTELKPKIGTISLWTMMELETRLGRGGPLNPIIVTKNADRDDYNEAYAIYYLYESNRIEGASSRDSLKQSQVYSITPFLRYRWHHLVITYDDEFLSFFVDGKLVGQSAKNYETQFNPLDSVVVATTASMKNARSFNGSVDDIEFYDRVLTEAEVLDLYNAPNPNKNKILLNWILLIASFVLLVFFIYLFIRHRLNLALKKERQRLELYNIVLETELRVNRALMNPHFVFNSLNALQNFILKNQNAQANNYLVKFSKLMRRILESNMSDAITLEFEIQLLQSYLEIENLRFEENFKYAITVDPAIIPSAIKIPIMMLQPFIENSIWHGLLKKTGEKVLSISFSRIESTYILCVIEDNGAGRRKNENPGFEKNSLATGFIEQRLNLLNRIHNLKCTLLIEDKPGNTGTVVKILLPILNR